MSEQEDLAEELEVQRRLNSWLRNELERQRNITSELRKAVADLARTFQESLAQAYEAGESGDIARVRAITRANQAHWQHYLQQIIEASKRPDPNQPRPEPDFRRSSDDTSS
jgi:hypothetical protein